MRIAARGLVAGALSLAVVLPIATAACGGAGLFRQYEYEEEMYLSLDGSATVYVNTSIAALNALRGTSFDASPAARFDRDAFRRYFSSADTHVTRVSSSRRSGRRFVHVRLEVDDVRRLGEAPPFSWSTYRFDREGDRFRFRQTVEGSAHQNGPSLPEDAPRKDEARRQPARTGLWTGKELVAFRLHLPSKILGDNTGRPIGRGNILTWEQDLTDRLRGVALTFDAEMQTQSILYRTLWLFGLTLVAVAAAFVAVIWWIVRRGKRQHPQWAERAG